MCLRGTFGLALALALAGWAAAQERRMLDDAEAPAYRAVGRLNVAGTRFCTATLVSERVVLTAAHCLFNPRSGLPVAVEELRFVAGQRRDAHAALRGVLRVAIAPGFTYRPATLRPGTGSDLAALALDAPVAPDVAAPLAAGADWTGAGPVTIVSYARDRPYAPSIRENCPVQGAWGQLVVLDCTVTFGVSGAPVFEAAEGAPALVAVVSAMGRDSAGREISLAVPIAPWLDGLLDALAAGAEDSGP